MDGGYKIHTIEGKKEKVGEEYRIHNWNSQKAAAFRVSRKPFVGVDSGG